MMTQVMYEEGLAYAESNFKDEYAPHLHVDKRLIREKFNMDGKRVLDFGCGMGGMSLWYATNFKCEVHGVDIDRHHVKIANDLKAKHKVTNVNFEVRNVLDNPIDDKYDFIVMNDVAEHIQLPILKAIFKELSKNLASNGGIYVSYPPWRSPYASHVQHVVGLPWCQFLPDGILLKMIEKNNRPIVGEEESDLLQAYKGLNHLTHERLLSALDGSDLKPVYRKSHSFLNKYGLFKEMNLRFFPFDFLVTKEFLLLQKAA
ncbi:MAG: class I SAM-dependent methyltransferase [Saprospiraceae bacterium]|jgi:2-polyprenyl-3-methyl-5-hydroxy-6-metoxy-1,4-benzoquinol methylase|nr:class I SAM-dependent methyltransferase [Saprospiraceae bacterium]